MKKTHKFNQVWLDRLIALGLGIIFTFSFYTPAKTLINDVSNNLFERQISASTIDKFAATYKNISYCNTTNPAQSLDIYLPAHQDTPAPLIIFIHGGGWQYGDKVSKVLSYYGQPLLKQGVALASLNYRMHPASHYPDAHDDINCALSFLAENADTYKLSKTTWGIMGDSAGAELAAYGLQANPDKPIKAFVGLYGPYDLSLQLTRAPRHDVNAVNFLNSRDISFARSVSPIAMPVKTSASYLLIHGKADKIVPIEQSENYYETLKTAGANARFIAIANTGHYISPTSKPSRQDIQHTIQSFFLKQLQ